MEKYLLVAGLGVLAGALLFGSYPQTFSGAQSGQASFLASSTVAVGPQEDKTIFSARPGCANRIIGTAGSIVYLSFHSSFNPSDTIGFPIAASTTMALDSDLYGCGAVTAAAAASSTIVVTEFSQ